MRRRVATAGWGDALWLLIGVAAAVGWYSTAASLARRWGLAEAATALGILVAAAVVLTLWRWAADDRARMALEAHRCPHCEAELRNWHEHARPGALAAGLGQWECAHCGFQRSEPLTCPDCAA